MSYERALCFVDILSLKNKILCEKIQGENIYISCLEDKNLNAKFYKCEIASLSYVLALLCKMSEMDNFQDLDEGYLSAESCLGEEEASEILDFLENAKYLIVDENINFTESMINKYGNHIAVSIDSRDRMIAVKGWKEINKQDSVEFCIKLDEMGIDTIIYTDISKDGKLSGTNLEIYKELREKVSCSIIASGGVTFEEEIIKLRDMNINGAIVGKAIYENKLDLKKIITLVS